MRKSAGILVIGNEILAGTFAEENAAFLVGELRRLGVRLRRIEVIEDDEGEIADAVQRLASSCDVVFTSGGVGPTHDDVTVAGVARAFGIGVERHPELVTLLEKHYGAPLRGAQADLARVPDGADLVFGDPRWPVMCVRNVYLLPGVPALFRALFTSIADRFTGARPRVARLYCTCDETELAAELTRAVADHPSVSFGSYPRFGESEYRVILTIEGEGDEEVRAALDALRRALGERVASVSDVQDAPVSSS